MIQDITVNKLTKTYNGEYVLKEYSHVFRAGTISCIMGKSGAGKTTLLRMIMGLEKQDSGSIIQCGRISPVFQEDRLLEELSPIGNVKLVVGRTISNEQIEEQLRCVLPPECLHKKTKELSGGMRRRVSIVRAMMRQSETILMDEPFTGLDVDTKKEVIQYIKAQRQNRTALIVTHDELDATALAAEICILTTK